MSKSLAAFLPGAWGSVKRESQADLKCSVGRESFTQEEAHVHLMGSSSSMPLVLDIVSICFNMFQCVSICFNGVYSRCAYSLWFCMLLSIAKVPHGMNPFCARAPLTNNYVNRRLTASWKPASKRKPEGKQLNGHYQCEKLTRKSRSHWSKPLSIHGISVGKTRLNLIKWLKKHRLRTATGEDLWEKLLKITPHLETL